MTDGADSVPETWLELETLAARIYTELDGKTSVRVYDYADLRVPVLRAMHTRRLATYKRLGFSVNEPAATSLQLAVPILVA